jgi:hypothetical protein
MEASFGPRHIVFLIFKNACFTQNNVPTSSALDPDVFGPQGSGYGIICSDPSIIKQKK